MDASTLFLYIKIIKMLGIVKLDTQTIAVYPHQGFLWKVAQFLSNNCHFIVLSRQCCTKIGPVILLG